MEHRKYDPEQQGSCEHHIKAFTLPGLLRESRRPPECSCHRIGRAGKQDGNGNTTRSNESQCKERMRTGSQERGHGDCHICQRYDRMCFRLVCCGLVCSKSHNKGEALFMKRADSVCVFLRRLKIRCLYIPTSGETLLHRKHYRLPLFA